MATIMKQKYLPPTTQEYDLRTQLQLLAASEYMDMFDDETTIINEEDVLQQVLY